VVKKGKNTPVLRKQENVRPGQATEIMKYNLIIIHWPYLGEETEVMKSS